MPTEASHKLAHQLLGLGTKQADVAMIMGMSVNTLVKHYPEEIKNAAAQVNAQVKTNLFAMTKHNVAAAIFWLKNRDKDEWKDRHDVVASGTFSWAAQVEAADKKAQEPNGKK